MSQLNILFLIVTVISAALVIISSLKLTGERKENKRLQQLIGELKNSKAADEHLIRSLRLQVEKLENRLRESRL